MTYSPLRRRTLALVASLPSLAFAQTDKPV